MKKKIYVTPVSKFRTVMHHGMLMTSGDGMSKTEKIEEQSMTNDDWGIQ